jgi:hypothetical protein
MMLILYITVITGQWLFSGVSTQEQGGDSDIFIDIFPVYADAFADKPPLFSLVFTGITQPGKPFNRDTYFPAIKELDMHHIGIEPHRGSQSLARWSD